MKNIKQTFLFLLLCSAISGLLHAGQPGNKIDKRMFCLGLGATGTGCVLLSDSWSLRLFGLVLAGAGFGMYQRASLGDVYARLHALQAQAEAHHVEATAANQRLQETVENLSSQVNSNHTETKAGLAQLVERFVQAKQEADRRHSESMSAMHDIGAGMEQVRAEMQANQTALLQAIRGGQSGVKGAVVTRMSFGGKK